MIKANSLLYAIYICLIVSVLCGALLYLANIYNQLNIYYTSHEELYIHNQSAVNYALGTLGSGETEVIKNETVTSFSNTKQFGVFPVVITKSFIKNDTVSSAHFIGSQARNNLCLYLTDFNTQLSYSGKVILGGDKKLPSTHIKPLYIQNRNNVLINNGNTQKSAKQLPQINAVLKEIYTQSYFTDTAIPLASLEKFNDSIYYNSFANTTKEVLLTTPTLSGQVFKGNFILKSSAPVLVSKSCTLEDVILIAPEIVIEEGFKGTLQAFATKNITINRNVTLSYPSFIGLYNSSTTEEAMINIKEGSVINGAIALFGVPYKSIDKNSIKTEEGSHITGDIYCEGRLSLKSNVYGSVYTNKFLLETSTSKYENCIADIEINVNKRPDYFVAIPLFFKEHEAYGIIKKVW